MAPIMQKFELVAKQTNTAVLIIHHSGKDKTKGARGSSSIFAHISTEILVTDEDGIKTATFTKQRELGSKGLEIPYKLEIVKMGQSIFGKPFSTCVSVHDSGERIKNEGKNTDKKLDKFIKYFKMAWKYSGKEDLNGKPYISKNGLKGYLINEVDISERTVKNYMTPSRESDMIGYLFLREYVEIHPNGFIVSNPELQSSMMISRGVNKC